MNDHFIQEIYQWYLAALHHPDMRYRNDVETTQIRCDALLHLLIRTILVWFLKSNGWLDDAFILKNGKKSCNDNTNADSEAQQTYYGRTLRPLLEYVFANRYHSETPKLQQQTCFSHCIQIASDAFAENRILFVPDDLWWHNDLKQPGLFDILGQYTFSLSEQADADEHTLSPVRIGTVFEHLLAVYTQTEDTRRKTGSYYTPDAVVDEMVISSLISVLCSRHPDIEQADVESLCRKDACPQAIGSAMRERIVSTLDDLKIWDPACGCGAFPTGVLRTIACLHKKLGSTRSGFELKCHIIANNLYGADIQPLAVEITKLRLNLSLLAELRPDRSKPNLGAPELPCLVFHFVCADTTMKLPESAEMAHPDIFESRVKSLRSQLQALRRNCAVSLLITSEDAKRDAALRKELSGSDNGTQYCDRMAAGWDPYQPGNAANYFDPLWMYGLAADNDGRCFDLVIGNPPYGTEISAETKQYYKQHYSLLEKKYDIYMVFFERGFELCKGTLCYITPDKWLSKSFAARFRENLMMPYMAQVIHLGQNVFSSVMVDAIISLFNCQKNDALKLYKYSSTGALLPVCTVDKSGIQKPYLIDPFFSETADYFKLLEQQPYRLGTYCKCEYAMASPKDAYTLRDLMDEATDVVGSDSFKIVNTGTIGKYIDRWGKKKMKYLKLSIDRPIVSKQRIRETFGPTFLERMLSPKVIIKGLNLLDACVDHSGLLMSTVATLMIRSYSLNLLNVVSLILNSQLISDYMKSKYLSSSYCGGLEFTPNMINEVPVPDLDELCMDTRLMCEIDTLMYSIPNADKYMRLEEIVRKMYSYQE